MPAGPVLLAFDGSPGAARAIGEAGVLLGARPALVVTVWEPGLAYPVLEPPAPAFGVPTVVDVQTAVELDAAVREQAVRIANAGVAAAQAAGFTAEALVAEDRADVAATLVHLARERDAQALVLGSHGHGALRERLLGSTSTAVARHAHCPVLLVAGGAHGNRGASGERGDGG